MSENADVLVIFGITGDLAKKMTFRALYRLEARGRLKCPIIGVGRREDWDHENLRTRAHESIETTVPDHDEKVMRRLATRMTFLNGDYTDPKTYAKLAEALEGKKQPVFYLEVPPSLFSTVVRGLGAGWADQVGPRCGRKALRPRPRIGQAAQCRAARGAGRGADLPHRPLPRQGAGDGHHLPALHQHAAGADLEPPVRLPRAR